MKSMHACVRACARVCVIFMRFIVYVHIYKTTGSTYKMQIFYNNKLAILIYFHNNQFYLENDLKDFCGMKRIYCLQIRENDLAKFRL